ncbi:hypothetical protein [Pseudomonas aeruginosa]
MTESKICTCPSGDGSLRWPCPAHPADQAGGDERAAFELFVRKHCGMPAHIAVNWDAKFTNDAWEGWKARAALAQPSPAPAEAERPEVEEVSEFEREDIASSAFETAMADGISLDSFLSLSNTLAARYDRIVGELRAEIAEWQEAAGRSRSDVVAYIAERAKLLEERDAAQARVAELEGKLTDWVREGFRLNEALAMAQTRHSMPGEFIGRLSEFLAQRGATGKALLRELRTMLAAAPGKEGV